MSISYEWQTRILLPLIYKKNLTRFIYFKNIILNFMGNHKKSVQKVGIPFYFMSDPEPEPFLPETDPRIWIQTGAVSKIKGSITLRFTLAHLTEL